MADQSRKDNLGKLQAAGVQTDQIPDAQRQVLNELSPEEVDILIRINERMQATSGDVQGYMRADFGRTIF